MTGKNYTMTAQHLTSLKPVPTNTEISSEFIDTKKGSFHVIFFFNPDTYTHTHTYWAMSVCTFSVCQVQWTQKHMKLHAGRHNGHITALWVIPCSFIPASLLSTLCASSPIFTPVTSVCHLNKRREKTLEAAHCTAIMWQIWGCVDELFISIVLCNCSYNTVSGLEVFICFTLIPHIHGCVIFRLKGIHELPYKCLSSSSDGNTLILNIQIYWIQRI